jgi:hypothetical protein
MCVRESLSRPIVGDEPIGADCELLGLIANRLRTGRA